MPRSRLYPCPLCQSPLSAARYRAVIRQHEGFHRAMAKAVKTAEAVARRQQSRLTSYQQRLDKVARERDEQAEEIRRLTDQVKRGSTPQADGLLEEARLLEVLRDTFRGDRFAHPGKGGDIVQTVICDGAAAGVIVYECKKAKYQRKFVEQTRRAGQVRGATYSLLVTAALPKRNTQCWVDHGVIVITPQAVLAVAMTVRESLETIHRMRASESERNRAVHAVYDYLAGADYRARIEFVTAEIKDLERELAAERRSHETTWDKRVKHYAAIARDVRGVDGRLREFLSRSRSRESGLSLGSPGSTGQRRKTRAA